MRNRTETPATGEPVQLLRLKEVMRRTAKCRSDIYREAGKTFPAPLKIGERSIAWPAHEIEAWIAQRVEARERAG